MPSVTWLPALSFRSGLRSRVDVLRAMLRDRRPYQPEHLDPSAPSATREPAPA
jgi:hypothetical protein